MQLLYHQAQDIPNTKRILEFATDVITKLGPYVPILGICLGHQGIVNAFGGKVKKAKEIKHGKTSNIQFNGNSDLFESVINPFVATSYHSLIADKDNFPKCLKITSISLDDQEIMGACHEKYLIEGIQFHPESILTVKVKKFSLILFKW